ncbi:hypothetical protein EDF22_3683 [Rathayibacter sp. PhB127]|uniref:hypothetical protein n=1 Tax=Rathayibacter sp. PhB127 TaxID=2485176 RepID=UPI000FAF2A0D|nr:hypothetical protein [Rathayibacter sp. PhB127]ROS22177.1 hypothetical protein EDF22_3683 [Rathayibacter sp. PhB127]
MNDSNFQSRRTLRNAKARHRLPSGNTYPTWVPISWTITTSLVGSGALGAIVLYFSGA